MCGALLFKGAPYRSILRQTLWHFRYRYIHIATYLFASSIRQALATRSALLNLGAVARACNYIWVEIAAIDTYGCG